MQIIETNSYSEMSERAAEIIAAQLKEKKNSVFGFATGSTPIGLYKNLQNMYLNKEISFSDAKTVNLDEYCGLDGKHEQSYRYFMNSNLFNGIDIDIKNTYVPNGTADDFDIECRRYEDLINSLGGIDMQLLGIGHDGHIGFNEPDTYFPDITHRVKLTDMTVQANKRFFASVDEVPRYALTMGCGTIMRARKILIVISGADKEEIAKKALFGPVTPEVPASILQFHQNVTAVLCLNNN